MREVVGDWTPVPGQPWVTKLGESFVNDLGAGALPSDWHRFQYRPEGVTVTAGKAHERPISALPWESTAIQKLEEAQETELRPPPFWSIETGADQELPFQLSALP